MATPRHPSNDRCILVFARAPAMGTVKTRLATHLPPETVLRLYRCMVADTLDTLSACDADVSIHYYPDDALPLMRDWLGDGYRYVPQSGNGLGPRMKNAFRWAFAAGYQQAICLGTDIPDIRAEIIQEAFSHVRENACPVGPAADGGYYLIGFAAGRVPEPAFTDAIDWGGDQVLTDTIRRLAAAGLCVKKLPVLQDIDTIRDVAAFHARACRGAHWARRTAALIAALPAGVLAG
jgi:rSAM/selenodomain-associated transferase 1